MHVEKGSTSLSLSLSLSLLDIFLLHFNNAMGQKHNEHLFKNRVNFADC